MKRTLLLVGILFVGITSFAGGPEYEKAMGQALVKFEKCQSAPDFREAANQFERIANVAQGEWLPSYYRAHCFIIMSFIDKVDGETKDTYLDEAEKSITKMLELAPDESEAHTMHAFYYSGRLVVDPGTRGMKFGMLSGQAVGKALKLDPNNPRAQYMQIQNEMGKAQFFGKDITELCQQAKIAHDKFDEYPVVSKIHPTWGKRELQNLSTSCNTESHD